MSSTIQAVVKCNCEATDSVVGKPEYNLLPDFPEDFAVNCMIRAPRDVLMKQKLVCKRWNDILYTDLFKSRRKSHGFTGEWLYVNKRDEATGRNSLHTFDPIYKRWLTPPAIPWEFSKATDFGCQVLSGCHLYLFGGVDTCTQGDCGKQAAE
ncbi:hypothetical protein TSUD_300010 [Trifolium subterraneum]|uniref:F-box domain-containing protein n=1 Tax=Trifolium subterraneum TaxID=3900 RepID=A0A2Z6PAA7_TRISU|nr:hypothetical protein TSUD_300010 [Trifolium subterraneum]